MQNEQGTCIAQCRVNARRASLVEEEVVVVVVTIMLLLLHLKAAQKDSSTLTPFCTQRHHAVAAQQ